jgi:hypothetical protein
VRLLPAIVVALVFAAGVARADTLTAHAFTVLAAMPSVKVAFGGDLRFVVRYPNGASAASDLTKAYKTYEQEPQHLDDIVEPKSPRSWKQAAMATACRSSTAPASCL